MTKKKNIFTEEEIRNIAELGEVLRKIRSRLLAEGKIRVENGKTIFLEKKNINTN
jgi:hypothetical protein